MSVKAMAKAWDYEIPRDEKFVLLAYADHADHEGNNIYPAVETITKKTGYKSNRSIQTITRMLEEKKLLIARGYGPKSTRKWSMDMDWSPDKIPADLLKKKTKKFPKSKGGAKIAGVQKLRGAKNNIKGMQTVAPEPSINRHVDNAGALSGTNGKTPKTSPKPVTVPEEWIPLYNAFVAGFHRPAADQSELRFWLFGSSQAKGGAKGIKHYYRLGFTPEEVKLAFSKVERDNKITIKNPNSLFFAVDEIHRKNHPQGANGDTETLEQKRERIKAKYKKAPTYDNKYKD